MLLPTFDGSPSTMQGAELDGKHGSIKSERSKSNHLWSVNLTSYFLCAREAILRMSTVHGGKGGAIVNRVVRVRTDRGSLTAGDIHAASRGAIDTFTMGL